MPRAKRVAIAALAALLAGACAARAEPPPTPLLWKVSDTDNSVYLLGSFHALRADDYPLAPSVDAAFADAERVAFELAPAELESPQLAVDMRAAAALPPGQDLRGTLPAATWAKLEAYARLRNLDLDQYAHTEPWFVALVVTVVEMGRVGFDPEQGLDRHLIAGAVAAGKPVSGLETGRQQIDALDSMGPAEQRQMLDEALDGVPGFEKDLGELHALWRHGDDAGLYARMGTDLRAKYPQLYAAIDVARNRDWLPKVQAMLDGERHADTLVVVGSLHLLGDEGLVAMLRAKGYAVERVR